MGEGIEDAAAYLSAGSASEIEPGQPKVIKTDDDVIAVHNIDGEYFAISNVCPHAGAPLSQGFIDNGRLTCPWHGWSFPLSPVDPPRDGILRYTVTIEDGEVRLALPPVRSIGWSDED